MYSVLAFAFLFTVFLALFLVSFLPLQAVLKAPLKKRKFIKRGIAIWFFGYGIFVAIGTGPKNSDHHPPGNTSPYKLPWKAGVERFVAQGNRSLVSHRDGHLYAYDFWMPIGTEILAAREGEVIKVEDFHDGIGFLSNYVQIKHPDGTSAMYAHIQKKSSTVKIGEVVRQSQPIAFSGMVGQTLFPHLHFVVLGPNENGSIPISFQDVPGGVPLAGHFYTSRNSEKE